MIRWRHESHGPGAASAGEDGCRFDARGFVIGDPSERLAVFFASNRAFALEDDGSESTEPTAEIPTDPERAREPDGTFRSDDPSTPENEAWAAPAAPTTKRGRPRKKG